MWEAGVLEVDGIISALGGRSTTGVHRISLTISTELDLCHQRTDSTYEETTDTATASRVAMLPWVPQPPVEKKGSTVTLWLTLPNMRSLSPFSTLQRSNSRARSLRDIYATIGKVHVLEISITHLVYLSPVWTLRPLCCYWPHSLYLSPWQLCPNCGQVITGNCCRISGNGNL